jgi:feruloyl esterase
LLELLFAAQLASGLHSVSCENLASLLIENVRIESAEVIAAGVFEPPRRFGPPREPTAVPEPIPEHCRVKMVLTPSSDSRINVELWLPTDAWNGRFLMVGNGGWAGAIQGYGDMQAALRRGYATAGTDTGHSAADGQAGLFALGHPEKIVDFAYRAVHETADKSKRVIREYYDPPIRYAYFKGCSTGGRQAVMAAQRYPGDFDGIIAGALANRHIHMHTVAANRSFELARDASRELSEEKAALVNQSVMTQCDTLNEGFLNNPRQCRVDFSALRCTGSTSSDSCLTLGELATVKEFYNGTYFENGELVFSGQALGSPIGELRGTGDTPNPFTFDTIRILGFQDLDYDWRVFDLERDMPIIDEAVGWVDAVDPDLRAFKGHGGKLLLYAGWRDTAITPENTIHYYESVVREMGKPQDDWMRLFLAPGMGHCGGGPGINSFDTLSVLEAWREEGQPPAKIMGTNGQTGAQRPLCPFPAYAAYRGAGDLAEYSSWACTEQ